MEGAARWAKSQGAVGGRGERERKGHSDECKKEELKGREEEEKWSKRRSQLFQGGGYMTTYWGARTGTAKLTTSKK